MSMNTNNNSTTRSKLTTPADSVDKTGKGDGSMDNADIVNSSKDKRSTVPFANNGSLVSASFNQDKDVILNPTKDQLSFPGTRHFKRWLRNDGAILQEYLSVSCAAHRKYLRTKIAMDYLKNASPNVRLFYRGGNFKGLPTKGLFPVTNVEEIALALAIFFNNQVSRKKGTKCHKKGKNYAVSLAVKEEEQEGQRAMDVEPQQSTDLSARMVGGNEGLSVKQEDEQQGREDHRSANQKHASATPKSQQQSTVTNQQSFPDPSNDGISGTHTATTITCVNPQHQSLQAAYRHLQNIAFQNQPGAALTPPQLHEQLKQAQSEIEKYASQIHDLLQLTSIQKQVVEAQKKRMEDLEQRNARLEAQVAQQQTRLRELGDATTDVTESDNNTLASTTNESANLATAEKTAKEQVDNDTTENDTNDHKFVMV